MEKDPKLQKSLSGVQAKLTSNILPSFVNMVDYHILLKLLTHAEEIEAFNKPSLMALKLNILKKTYLFEQSSAIASQIGAEGIEEEQKKVEEKFTELKTKAIKALEPEQINDEDKDIIFEYAQFLYDKGDYDESEKVYTTYLKQCKSNHYVSIYWKLLSIYILTNNEKKTEIFKELDSLLSKEKMYDNDRLTQRNILVNTGMFLFKENQSIEFLNELMSKNQNVLASGSIHLLRYYVVVALLTSDFDVLNGSILPLIQSDSYRYRDALTVFIETLLEDYDYETALGLVSEIEAICDKDYFLSGFSKQVSEAAKNLILSVYSMIHHEDDTKEMIAKLNKEVKDTEAFKPKVLEYDEFDNIEEKCEVLRKACISIKDSLPEVITT